MQTLVYAIYNLCVYPEYVEPLRNEIVEASSANHNNPYEHMPLLDSFLRESARMNPLDARKEVIQNVFDRPRLGLIKE